MNLNKNQIEALDALLTEAKNQQEYIDAFDASPEEPKPWKLTEDQERIEEQRCINQMSSVIRDAYQVIPVISVHIETSHSRKQCDSEGDYGNEYGSYELCNQFGMADVEILINADLTRGDAIRVLGKQLAFFQESTDAEFDALKPEFRPEMEVTNNPPF